MVDRREQLQRLSEADWSMLTELRRQEPFVSEENEAPEISRVGRGRGRAGGGGDGKQTTEKEQGGEK